MRVGSAGTSRWPGASWPGPADLTASLPWSLVIDPLLCAAGDMIFGGWTMALIAEAAQGWTGGRVRALTANFLAPVRLGEQLTLSPVLLRGGRRVQQLRVEAQVTGRPVASAAVVVDKIAGDRGAETVLSGPVVPAPADCPQRSYRFRKPGSLIDVMDVRLASPEPSPGAAGRVLLWSRLDADVSDAARLIMLSDHLPYLVVRTLAGVRHATTVSASVRLSSSPATEWILLDIRLHDVGGEFCNGQVRLWSQAGSLVATAEQTTYLVMAS